MTVSCKLATIQEAVRKAQLHWPSQTPRNTQRKVAFILHKTDRSGLRSSDKQVPWPVPCSGKAGFSCCVITLLWDSESILQSVWHEDVNNSVGFSSSPPLPSRFKGKYALCFCLPYGNLCLETDGDAYLPFSLLNVQCHQHVVHCYFLLAPPGDLTVSPMCW